MMRTRSISTTALAAAVLVLTTACGSSTPEPASPAAPSPSASTSAGTPAGGGGAEVAELKTATSSLGTIVTDGKGMTLYMFDKDTKGGATSACTGQCLAAWPPALMVRPRP